MHVVFVTNELASTNNASYGLATFTANIARIFRDNGHYVEIILVTTKENDLEFDKTVPVHKFHIPLSDWMEYDYIAHLYTNDENKVAELRRNYMNIQKAKMVKKRIQQINAVYKIDIVHFSNHGSFSIFMEREIPYVTRISGFANILLGGGDNNDNLPSQQDLIEIHAMKKSPFIIVPSILLAEIGKRYLEINPVVIESPFELNSINYDYEIYNKYLENKKYILFYGHFRYYKGIHIIAHLAAAFLEKHKDRFLVMAGDTHVLTDDTDGEEIDAVDYVKKHARIYRDRVIYIGQIVREQLYPVIKNAECCLLPSRIENLSNACIEAMAMGKIVVATNGASYEQLIDDRVSGFLCERDNPASYLKAVDEVLAMSTEERNKIGLKAIEVTKRLEPQKIYEQYLAFYEKVIREW